MSATAAGVGFANLDIIYSGLPRLPKEGEEIYSEGFSMKLGGGIPATMTNLQRLGIRTKVATFLGQDIFSGFVESELRKEGVNCKNLYHGDGIPVNISTAMLTPHDRTFLSYRSPINITEQILEEAVQELVDADFIEMHVGFLDVYRRIKARNPHVTLVFDCGWDDDLSVEKYHEYLDIADYYTPNQKEALKITGTDSVKDAAEILGRYFDSVVIKLDRQGCYYLDVATGTERVIPPMTGVHCVDSTGAGDAFLSGFLYGLIHQCTVEQSIIYGNITGGTCVQGYGCLSEYATEKELLEKAKQW